MKKVIRLTESDLARIVMRVLNEQPELPRQELPKLDSPTDSRDEIIATKDAQIESLTNEINQIMKDLKMQRRENIDKKVVFAKQKIKKLINLTIEKIDKKIDNARIENKSNKLRKLEMEKEELKVKLSEIEKTGDVFSKEQKEKIVKSIVNIYGAILTSISAIFGINTIKHQYK
jgi:hypothetical protein